MKTGPVTASDLARSVLAVPPLARNPDLSLNRTANRALIRHLEAGGVSTLIYGGNANFYNIGAGDYAETVDLLAEAAGAQSWVVPSIGPDFGKMLDQVAILKERAFPTAMVLPLTFPSTPAGAVKGLRLVAERYGKPIIVYIKAEGYVTPEGIKALVDDGLVAAVKYAVVRPDPSQDAFLSRLVELVDRKLVVSGIGERPAVTHLRDFGVASFTSGSVCIAPRASMGILEALKRKDYATAERLRHAFLPLEDCRDGLSPIRVLHEAVSLAGIADMGPMLPLLENIEAVHHAKIGAAATELLSFDLGLASKAA
jgi:dihydrodipicolinate synthase/N-acetylneuraminate lyase